MSDPEKRKKYDQYGKDWQHAEQFEKAKQRQEKSSDSGGQRYSGAQSGRDFSDFFESMFGGSAGAGRNSQVKFRGEDYNAELHLDLIDAYKTHKQTMTVGGRKIRITIPAGIENGQTIKITGHGGPGINGGTGGDLYTAVLGGEITINTLNGRVKLKVKPKTQNGIKVKLKNKGFPVYKNEGQFGDLYITYNFKIPTNLTERHKELFAELSEL